jgi:prepilin peptidase CpaA
MVLPAAAAWWFLIVAVPVGLWVAYTDLSRMKITNAAVLTLFAGYVVLGFFALPREAYLWGYVHMIVVLVIGVALNAVGAVGAGDAKFAAAAAPIIATGDIAPLLYLFSLCLLGGWVIHRIARMTPLRRLAPEWASWTSGRRFPMGLPLAMTLLAYLGLAIYRGH